MSVPKAMPGQEPYTAEEWATAYKMAAFLARISENISEDELEEHAESANKLVK